jgi:N-methylhydantoinase A
VSSADGGWRFAADVGGTFTDVALVSPDAELWTRKVLSSPPNFDAAILEGLERIIGDAGIPPHEISHIAHATTVATNAVLERRGGPIGLITTEGFRDVLELRRMRLPEPHNIMWDKPAPLAPRRLREEVTERVSASGEVVTPLDDDSVRRAVKRLLEEGVAAIAVCLINAYVQPVHERRIGELIESTAPTLPYTLSSSLLPQIKEYERTSTTALNAYLIPVVASYLTSLTSKLGDSGVEAPLHVMQSNGGLTTSDLILPAPVYMIESGGAAGTVGAAVVAKALGLESVVAFDMGGTTTKASTVESGVPVLAAEYEVGGTMSAANLLTKGGGDVVRVSAISVAEIGAGGGSIVQVDNTSRIFVGPRSAGSVPGPICYGRGGTDPTVTDANVVLGYLHPEALLGGDFPIDRAAAVDAYAALGERLQSNALEAAFGVYQITNAAMARTVRAISTERGRDIRAYSLLVFGGSGAAHAVEMARILGIRKIIVPPAPGVFAAVGLQYADIATETLQTVYRAMGDTTANWLTEAYRGLEERAVGNLIDQGFTPEAITISRRADLHYHGQSFELSVAVPTGELAEGQLDAIADSFHRAYQEIYGYCEPTGDVDLVTLRVDAQVVVGLNHVVRRQHELSHQVLSPRQAYFGPAAGELTVDVCQRSDLERQLSKGPLIVEGYDSTVVIPPDANVGIDGDQNIVIELVAET